MKTLLLGFDAFDPDIFERLLEAGGLPHLSRYVQEGGYARFEVANPPQSEVSWTSIATGLNPGGHGLFDFVHRDPSTYELFVSLLPSRSGMGGTKFVPPFSARTIFDQAASLGYPATTLWWPATFPARPESPVRSIPGLGTPDIHGRLGVGAVFTSDPGSTDPDGTTPVYRLTPRGGDCYRGVLPGPVRKTRRGKQLSSLELQLEIKNDRVARLVLDGSSIDLYPGHWSPILPIRFKVGRFLQVHALTRAILTQAQSPVRLFFLPLQLHPLRSHWRYGTPARFVRQVWKASGPFLTIGWPQETVGLEEGQFDDDQFLALCDSIFEARSSTLLTVLENFREGIVAAVFDSLDRVEHMFLRDRPEVVEAWYRKYDALVGRVEDCLAHQSGEPARLVIVSDHGFKEFAYKVHLNRWLMDRGYLSESSAMTTSAGLGGLDWSRTRAYAIGLNSLYLNLAGREAQGQVGRPDGPAMLQQLRDELCSWKGPDGKAVVSRVLLNKEAFQGPLREYGPDLVIGYAPGYRASQETGLGGWAPEAVVANSDHWGADHCMDARAVPGVIFANQGLADFPRPTYQDIPALTIDAAIDPNDSPSPPPMSAEETRILEERLKSLGYL